MLAGLRHSHSRNLGLLTRNPISFHSRPVRDTACVAAGNFVKAYPEESKPQLDTLFGLFLANLKDPISSVPFRDVPSSQLNFERFCIFLLIFAYIGWLFRQSNKQSRNRMLIHLARRGGLT